MTKPTIRKRITTTGHRHGEPSHPARVEKRRRQPGSADTWGQNPSRQTGSANLPVTKWSKLGLRRLPWLTGAVVALTAAGGIAQYIFPDLLDQLQRSPAGLHGQWWRIATALVVQDGGVVGLVSNLIFLAAIGAVAEQVLTRRRWMLQYFGTGLLAELVGYAWQPIGGGNSIAICGLAGAVAVTSWRDRVQLPPWGPSVVLVWCGALLAYLWEPLIVLGIVGAMLAGRAVQTGRQTGRAILAVVLVTGVGLAAATNIHGAALLIGVALAFARSDQTNLTAVWQRSGRGRRRCSSAARYS